MSDREMEENLSVLVRLRPSDVCQWNVKDNTISRDASDNYVFEKIYDSVVTNEEIYDNNVRAMVQAALDGYNIAVCAYGQSGAGKTHTLSGSDCPGVIHLLFADLFGKISGDSRQFLVRVSYMEIYNEKINDLLDASKEDLQVMEKNGIPFVNLLTEKAVTSVEQVKQLLEQANELRQVAETRMNERSSRSHTILRVTIDSSDGLEHNFTSRTSTVSLVDLAGSESADATAGDSARQKEGSNINKSLHALTKVIATLSCKKRAKGHIPYRDSKLTRILKPCLGGSSKTLMICCISPAYTTETSSTLKFAKQVKQVKSCPTLNVVTEDSVLSKYLAEIDSLKQQLKEKENNDEDSKNRLMMLYRDVFNSAAIGTVAQPVRRVNRRATFGGQNAIPITFLPKKFAPLEENNAIVDEEESKSKVGDWMNRRYSKPASEISAGVETAVLSDMDDVLSDYEMPNQFDIHDKYSELEKENQELKTKIEAAVNETEQIKQVLTDLQETLQEKERLLEKEAEEVKPEAKDGETQTLPEVEDEIEKKKTEEAAAALVESQQKVTSLEQENSKLSTLVEDLKHKLTEDLCSKDELYKMKERSCEQSTQLTTLRQEVQTANMENTDLKDEMKILANKLAEATKMAQAHEDKEVLWKKEESRLHSEVRHLTNKLKELEAVSVKEVPSDDKVDVTKLQSDLESEKQSNQELTNQLKQLETSKQEEIDNLKDQLDKVVDKACQLEKDNKGLQSRVEALLEAEASILKESEPVIPEDHIVVSQEEIEEYQQKIADLSRKLSTREADLQSAVSKGSSLFKQLQDKKASLETYQRRNNDLLADIRSAGDEFKDLKRQLDEATEKLTTMEQSKTEPVLVGISQDVHTAVVDQLTQTKKILQKTTEDLERQKYRVEVDLRLAQADLKELRMSNETIRDEVTKQFAAKISHLEGENKTLDSKNEEQLKDLTVLKKQLNDEQNTVKRLIDKLARIPSQEPQPNPCPTNTISEDLYAELEAKLKEKEEELTKLKLQKQNGLRYLKELHEKSKLCKCEARTPLGEKNTNVGE